MITRLEHVGLSVSNLDRSVAFYRDLFGLEVLRVIDAGPTMRLGEIVGMPGCSARIAHLMKGDVMLELFEYTDPRGTPIPEGRRQADLGYIHTGFTSTDARADYARLKAAGVSFLSEPVEFRPGVWVVYFRGPDGEVGEIRQS